MRNCAHAWCERDDLALVTQSGAGASAHIGNSPEAREPDRTRGADDRIAELQLENSRLRWLVTDLLLEKVKLEEAAQSQSCVVLKRRAFR
jgi:hypothetical protein